MILGILLACSLENQVCNIKYKYYENKADCVAETAAIKDKWPSTKIEVETFCAVVGGEEA